MLGAGKKWAAARMRMGCVHRLLDEKEEPGSRLSGWLPGPGQQRLRQHQEAPADVGSQSPWPPWWTQLGRQSSSGSRGLR